MKIRHLIVTHKEPHLLNQQLYTIFADKIYYNYSLVILNNHPEFQIVDDFKEVTVVHNMVRSINSQGHLARDWNYGIISGFENLAAPACDLLILSQNDVYFNKGWLEKIVRLHDRFEYISYGQGDAVMSFSPGHVKKVGLFDEHFCIVGQQEGDYFLRSKRLNGDKVSINDKYHNRHHNEIDHGVIVEIPCGQERRIEERGLNPQVRMCSKYLANKWKNQEHCFDSNDTWTPKQHMFYPFFEKEVNQSNYLYEMT